MPTWTITQYVHQFTKAGGDSKFAVVDGAPKALDFRAVEPLWRVALEAASASRANPRTCRGADSGLPCFPLKEELVEAVEEVEILVPHERAQQWTVDRAPVELRLVPQERMQRVGEQNVEVSIPQVSEHNEQIVDVPVPQDEIAEVTLLAPHEVQQMNKSRS